MNSSARMEQLDVLRIQLGVLRQEHRDLDDAIRALEASGTADPLTVKRLKKQKTAPERQDCSAGRPRDAGYHRLIASLPPHVIKPL